MFIIKKVVKLTLSVVITVCLIVIFAGCHTHKSAGKVSCTEDEICAECGKVIKKASGHTPGADATCTEDQVCEVCGEVLVKAHGHSVENSGSCTDDEICSVCGEVLKAATGHIPGAAATSNSPQTCEVCGEIINYLSADSSGKTVDFIPETIAGGHYNNNIDAYYSGNVLVCGNYALEYFSLNESGNSAYAGIINSFADKYPNVNVTSLLVPKSCAFNSPEGYTNQYENEYNFINNTYGQMNAKVKTADCIGVMANHRGEYLYYRTDHHWTSLGAYYASVAYCNANSIAPLSIGSYKKVVNTGFIGTLYGYCYSPKPSCLLANPDYTVGHLPQTEYKMTYKNGGITYTGTAINESSKTYASMFICGDQPFTDIVTENKNGKKLIVFKESYGNAFVPYMIDYFEEIIVIDVRYDTDSIESIINEYGITDALVINNVQGALSLFEQLSSKLAS